MNTWKLFFGIGVVMAIFSMIAFFGPPPDPDLVENVTGSSWEELQKQQPGVWSLMQQFRSTAGQFMLLSAVFTMVIAAIPFKEGRLWAWYSMWTIPVLLAGSVIQALVWDAVVGYLFALLLSASVWALLVHER